MEGVCLYITTVIRGRSDSNTLEPAKSLLCWTALFVHTLDHITFNLFRENHSWQSTEERKECFIQEVSKKDLFLLSYRVCLFVAITVTEEIVCCKLRKKIKSKDIFVLHLQVYTMGQVKYLM